MDKIDKSVAESLVAKFKTFGLSTYAARTYLTLLSHSSASASYLCKETGIPDSKMYYALSELAKKSMIIVQTGTPSMYKPMHPKEAISNLKQQLADDTNQKITQADALAEILSPIFENAEGKEEIELAYVIRRRRNIVKKMKDLIGSAKKEAAIFISEKDLLDELIPSIKEAETHVETKLALNEKLLKAAKLNKLKQPRILTCSCNIIISDMKTLITISSWKNEIAIMTNDKGLINITRESYENPRCCEETS